MIQHDQYINKARESLQAAELLLKEGFTAIAASRAYYAMFYLAEMLLYSKGLAFSSHSAVIAAYGKEFAKTKLLDPEHHRHLKEAFETRQIGDYILEPGVSMERAAALLSWAWDFFMAAEEYIAQNRQKELDERRGIS